MKGGPTPPLAELKDLARLARAARRRAHAPFSHFKVGAALRTRSGEIVTGCNIENASYGLTLCAERVAVFKAVSEGMKRFDAVAVVADSRHLTPPCGPCRQILWEFCGDIVGAHGRPQGPQSHPEAFRAPPLPLRRSASLTVLHEGTRGQPMSRSPASRWAVLLTESRNPRSRRLDALPTRDVVRLLLDEDRRALVATLRQAGAVARAATLVARSLSRGGHLVFLGAGTSGRLGVLEAAECPPTFGISARTIRAVIAGGQDAVFASREGAEDRDDHGRREGARLRRGDVLVGISASSVTPFVRGALESRAEARRPHRARDLLAPPRALSPGHGRDRRAVAGPRCSRGRRG